MTRRVVIVDDAPEIAHLVALTLNTVGIETIQWTDHFDSLTTNVDWHQIDAVIVDKLLGIVDGTHFLNWLKKEHPHVRRIMLTGSTSIDVAASPAQIILIKPASPEDIRAAVLDG